MVKKMSMLLFAGGLVMLLSACGQKAPAEKTNAPETSGASKPAADKGGVISSIADAFASGQKVQCSYSKKDATDTEASNYVMYIDGKNFKTRLTSSNENQQIVMNSIFISDNGGTVYSWTEGQKIGTKFSIDCMKEVTKDLSQAQQNQQANDPQNAYKDALDVKCSPASSVDLTIPSDITFNDQCEMMKGLIQNMPKVPNVPNIPKNIPNYPGQ